MSKLSSLKHEFLLRLRCRYYPLPRIEVYTCGIFIRAYTFERDSSKHHLDPCLVGLHGLQKFNQCITPWVAVPTASSHRKFPAEQTSCGCIQVCSIPLCLDCCNWWMFRLYKICFHRRLSNLPANYCRPYLIASHKMKGHKRAAIQATCIVATDVIIASLNFQLWRRNTITKQTRQASRVPAGSVQPA